MVEFLNSIPELSDIGKWKRQDTGFPDTVFDSHIYPKPGFEIKAWFPLATEITARFKDSQNFFTENQTNVLLIAWLPENLLFGRPKIIDVCSVTGKSVAQARDNHYFNPPDYLVLEPEDTSGRTSNLQQTNTNGYKMQGTQNDLVAAKKFMEDLHVRPHIYEATPEFQTKIKSFIEKFPYRLDTNYAKIDRIEHEGIERFKNKTLNSVINGKTIKEWARIIGAENSAPLITQLKTHFDISN